MRYSAKQPASGSENVDFLKKLANNNTSTHNNHVNRSYLGIKGSTQYNAVFKNHAGGSKKDTVINSTASST